MSIGHCLCRHTAVHQVTDVDGPGTARVHYKSDCGQLEQKRLVVRSHLDNLKGMQALTEKNISIKHLLLVIFGHKTEKKKKSSGKKTGKRRKKQKKGQGKNSADEYTGALRENINHDTLRMSICHKTAWRGLS